MSAPSAISQGEPWYRQFWPWFIVGLLGVSVVGSLTTVFIAVRGADPDVRGEWNVDAKAVHPVTDARDLARANGVGALLGLEAAGGRLSLEVWSPGLALPDRLAAHFAHPTLAERDVVVVFVREADGVYAAERPAGLGGRYEIAIAPEAAAQDAAWEIIARGTLTHASRIAFGSPRGSGDPRLPDANPGAS